MTQHPRTVLAGLRWGSVVMLLTVLISITACGGPETLQEVEVPASAPTTTSDARVR